MGLIGYLSKLPERVNQRRVMLDACMVALLISLGFAAKPAYSAFRAYRLDRSLAAAKVAASHEDWITARDKARSVLMVRHNDFEAFRIWVRALAKLGDPEACVAEVQLFFFPRASRDDRLEMLQLIALQAPQAVAFGAFGSLPADLRNQASFRAALTPLLVQRGSVAAAEEALREVMEPTDGPKVRLELLRTLCARPTVGRIAEARRIFAALIAGNADEEALAALLLLGETPGGLAPGVVLPDLPEWLKGRPKATALHHLLGMHPALEGQPDSADRLYEYAVQRFLATDPCVLGDWLARHKQGERAIQVLAEPAKTRADAYLTRLHVLLSLGKDDEVDAALAFPPAAPDPVGIEIVRACLAWHRNNPNAADTALTRAMNHAAFDTTRNRFIEIARIAEVRGAKASAENAWVAAFRLGWGQLPLYNDLLPVLAGLADKGRSEDLLAIFQTMLRFETRNPELLDHFHYLALIHGVLPPDQVAAAQEKLVAALPGRLEFNATLMLAKMLGSQPADALALLPKVRDSRGVPPMRKTALEGTARLLAGETAAGTALLGKVNWLSLMRQERIVFRDALMKLKLSEVPIPELKTAKEDENPGQTPAWRKAMERLEKDRANDVLPALPPPHVPAMDSKPADPPESPPP